VACFEAFGAAWVIGGGDVGVPGAMSGHAKYSAARTSVTTSAAINPFETVRELSAL